MEKIQERKNTVIHLANVSMDWPFAKKMFNEIASQLITEDANVILLLETSQEILGFLELPDNILSADDPEKALTLVYQLIPNGKQSKWERIPFDHPDFNMRFHWHLTTFFREYIIKRNPAERYFLFLWGHGTSYSIFPETPVEESEAGASIGQLSADHLSRAIIDASTFTSTFKISVMLMINCYMQTIETGYELSIAQTDYLIAPENVGSWEGYDYKELFRILFTDPSVTSEDFARTAIITLSSHDSPIKDPENAISQSAFSAINLQNYGVLFRLIDELAIQLLIVPEADISKIFTIQIPIVSKNGTVDLGDFLSALQMVFKKGYKEMNKIINKILVVLRGKTLIIESFTGKDVSLPPPFSFHGIAIGFFGDPDRGDSFFYLRYFHKVSPFASTFTKTNTWGRFTEKYFPPA